MQYRQLGRTGLMVSPLAVGTMNFGDVADEAESGRILDRAISAGLNFIDTADVYGSPQRPDLAMGSGLSEEIIGRWLKSRGARNQVVLATKCYQPMGLGPNDRRLSAYHIRSAVEASLRRLGTDRIDLLQMHHMDRLTPIDEILEALSRLIADGKVLYVGSCNFAAWYLAAFQSSALARHMLGRAGEQTRYNLTVRTPELELLPACRHFGLGFLPYSPLAGGLLAGGLSAADQKSGATRRARLGEAFEKKRTQVAAYEALAQASGFAPATLAIAWLLSNPVVTAPIVGPRTVAQLEGALAALDVKLSKDVLTALDEIWPGPGGEAPEAYAW